MAGGADLIYFVFDLLYRDGWNLIPPYGDSNPPAPASLSYCFGQFERAGDAGRPSMRHNLRRGYRMGSI
jgi:hypothetical protein